MRPEPFDRYEAALRKLSKDHRETVVMRLDLGYSYAQIASAMGKSTDAARMTVARALVELAKAMHDHREG